MSVRRRSIVYGGARPALTYQGPTSYVTGTSTHTHSGCGFGANDPTRLVFAVIGYTNGTGGSITSCTIGGVTATLVVSAAFTSGTGAKTYAEIWLAAIPTGSSGSVVISGPSGNWASAVSTYSATGLASSTPIATSGDDTSPINLSVSVQALGIVIAVAFDTAAVSSHSWTGVTQDFYSFPLGSGIVALTGASANPSANGSLAITATFDVGNCAGVAASFR